MTDLIQYAVHKDRENRERFEIGLKNLTLAEGDQVLALLAQMQDARR